MRELFDETKDFAFSIYLSYIKTSMLSEATINIEFVFEAAGFFTFTPWRGFFTMGNTIKALVFDWAIKIMMLTKFQEVLLRFIAIGLFQALFVIGAILRTFMFTRRLGGLLLGMAIAFYFVFPAFYAYGALVMIDLKEKARPAWMADTTANPDGYKNPQPDSVLGVDLQDLGSDPELYRYNFLIKNHRDADDYRAFMRFARTLSQTGPALERAGLARNDLLRSSRR
jgi:hypothetical protein